MAWLQKLLDPHAVAVGKDKYRVTSLDFQLFDWFIF